MNDISAIVDGTQISGSNGSNKVNSSVSSQIINGTSTVAPSKNTSSTSSSSFSDNASFQ